MKKISKIIPKKKLVKKVVKKKVSKQTLINNVHCDINETIAILSNLSIKINSKRSVQTVKNQYNHAVLKLHSLRYKLQDIYV